jgi:hypothetical protein
MSTRLWETTDAVQYEKYSGTVMINLLVMSGVNTLNRYHRFLYTGDENMLLSRIQSYEDSSAAYYGKPKKIVSTYSIYTEGKSDSERHVAMVSSNLPLHLIRISGLISGELYIIPQYI